MPVGAVELLQIPRDTLLICAMRRSILARVKFLSRLFTALNLLPSIATLAYAGLVRTLRARKEALDVSFATLEDIGGLQAGYLSKLMSPTAPSKVFGPVSLELTLAALGVKILIVEDAAAMARIRSRLVPRYRAGDAHHTVSHGRRSRAQPAAPSAA